MALERGTSRPLTSGNNCSDLILLGYVDGYLPLLSLAGPIDDHKACKCRRNLRTDIFLHCKGALTWYNKNISHYMIWYGIEGVSGGCKSHRTGRPGRPGHEAGAPSSNSPDCCLGPPRRVLRPSDRNSVVLDTWSKPNAIRLAYILC